MDSPRSTFTEKKIRYQDIDSESYRCKDERFNHLEFERALTFLSITPNEQELLYKSSEWLLPLMRGHIVRMLDHLGAEKDFALAFCRNPFQDLYKDDVNKAKLIQYCLEESSVDCTMFWTFAPYLSKALRARGLSEKEAMQIIFEWAQDGREGNVNNMRGLAFLDKHKINKYNLPKNQHHPVHKFTEQEAERIATILFAQATSNPETIRGKIHRSVAYAMHPDMLMLSSIAQEELFRLASILGTGIFRTIGLTYDMELMILRDEVAEKAAEQLPYLDKTLEELDHEIEALSPSSQEFIVRNSMVYLQDPVALKNILKNAGYKSYTSWRELQDAVRDKTWQGGTYKPVKLASAVNVNTYTHAIGTFFCYEGFYLLGDREKNSGKVLNKGEKKDFENWVFLF